MNRTSPLVFALPLFTLLLAGCVTPDDDHRHDASVSPAPQGEQPPSAAKSAPSADPSTPHAAAAEFPAEPGWIVETPTSAMRKAQFRLPHAEGDADDASLVVYHFGAQAGTREANLERWTGQFEQPDGRPSSEVVKTASHVVDGREIYEVDLAGTYVAETSPGSGERVRKPGWRMLAAILDTSNGSYYVKLVGPAATLARWESSYSRFVNESRSRLR